MTNEEVNQFFIENGAYPDFEIVNSPMFQITVDINGRQLIKSISVATLQVDVITFINNYLNNTSKKWYVFNNCIDNMDITTTIFRCAWVDSHDRLLKHRGNKLQKILSKTYDKLEK